MAGLPTESRTSALVDRLAGCEVARREPVERLHRQLCVEIRVVHRFRRYVKPAVFELHGVRLVREAKHVRLGHAARSLAVEERRERVQAPVVGELVPLAGRAQRAGSPAGERIERLLELLAVLGQLVHGRRRGWGQLSLLDDAARLELAQTSREDVRADPGHPLQQVGVALRALEELPHDEECPPLADEAEGVTDGAVLVVALAHALVL